jgi:hypothetical protein
MEYSHKMWDVIAEYVIWLTCHCSRLPQWRGGGAGLLHSSSQCIQCCTPCHSPRLSAAWPPSQLAVRLQGGNCCLLSHTGSMRAMVQHQRWRQHWCRSFCLLEQLPDVAGFPLPTSGPWLGKTDPCFRPDSPQISEPCQTILQRKHEIGLRFSITLRINLNRCRKGKHSLHAHVTAMPTRFPKLTKAGVISSHICAHNCDVGAWIPRLIPAFHAKVSHVYPQEQTMISLFMRILLQPYLLVHSSVTDQAIVRLVAVGPVPGAFVPSLKPHPAFGRFSTRNNRLQQA